MAYEKAAAMLWAKVPAPAKKKAKAQKTWKTLELGREVALISTWFDGQKFWEPGAVFKITEVTNLGVELVSQENGKVLNWTREWKGTFKKVAKRRATKAVHKTV